MNGNNVIEVRHVDRIFSVPGGHFQALTDINVEIPPGVLAILKGRSGSGKTTLLNIMGLLDEPSAGQVIIDGQDAGKLSAREREKRRREQMGFVFQAVSLIPTMNAFQNVEFSMRMAGIRSGSKERVAECLRMVGLSGRQKHMPAEMSGGEQQRVAIARALAHRPGIIFADEPTSELDSAMGAEVVRLFKEMCRKEGVTIVMTTHDVGLMDAGDMVIELENGYRKSRTDEAETSADEGKAKEAEPFERGDSRGAQRGGRV